MRIYLANNSLQQLPSTLFDLSNLRVLSLRHNDLVEIPSAIERLANLQTLNIANNKLEYLPYELLQLIRVGKIQYLVSEPNPWRTYQPYEVCDDSKDIAISRILPLPGGVIHSIRKVAESAPEYLQHNGMTQSILRGTRSISTMGEGKASSVPSLLELTLLKCCKLQDLSDLPEWLEEDVSTSVSRLLRTARDVQQSGGRHCTACHRDMILPRVQWVEWWSTTNVQANIASAVVLPFLRRQCSLSCTDESGISQAVEDS